jgi:hypothetical protein
VSLRYALLALLRVGPLSGYDLQKQFSLSVGHVWHAPDSQIYPELRKMETEGLIEGEGAGAGPARQPPGLPRDGCRKPGVPGVDAVAVDYQRVRDPAHLRAAYLENTTPEAARAFFLGHIAEWESELEQWEQELRRIDARDNPMLVRRLAVTATSEHERTVAYKRFTYEGLVDRANSEIAWAKRGLALVDRLDA